MRTYGRTPPDENGNRQWIVVQTDANGQNGYVWLTTLTQVLQLNLGESPFYASYGIPAVQSVLSQLYPDLYVQITQQQFAKYFASLSIIRMQTTTPDANGQINPIYQVNVTFFDGTTVQTQVAT